MALTDELYPTCASFARNQMELGEYVLFFNINDHSKNREREKFLLCPNLLKA
jgi:hypothetical protein